MLSTLFNNICIVEKTAIFGIGLRDFFITTFLYQPSMANALTAGFADGCFLKITFKDAKDVQSA